VRKTPNPGQTPEAKQVCDMLLQSAQLKLPGELEEQRPILGHIVIEAVEPAVDGGRYPAKRIVGEPCVVEADIFRDGHQIIRAALKYRRKSDESFAESPMMLLDDDRWRGEFVPNENARYVYTIEGWTDLFASWLSDFRKKVVAGRDVRSDLLEGVALIEKMIRRATTSDREILARCLEQLRASQDGFASALKIVEEPRVIEAAERVGERYGLFRYEPYLELVVDRPKARFSTWYEMFPRSQGTDPKKPATFRQAERRLPGLADMGFDVVYLPPIHPIGVTNRKGPNNSLAGGDNAPGSPWAIGNEAGGHDAVHPELGTVADFQHFVATAANLGIETAIDRGAVFARSSMGARASRMVQPSPRRQHQIRGESTQGISGHLSDRFRY